MMQASCPTLATRKPGQFTEHQPHARINYMRDIRILEQLVMAKAGNAKLNVLELAKLVHAFCEIMECVRVMRGVPLPGQFRPVATKAQLDTMLKRARKAALIDIDAIADERAEGSPLGEAEDPSPGEDTTSEKSKESL
jgi:hypothetical protein